MLGSPSDTARRPEAVEALETLLRDLGPQLRRGTFLNDQALGQGQAPPLLETGIPGIDQLVGGGFPRGRISEIAGPLSSGRTTVTLSLLARTTRAGEITAVVDAADAFDPTSAQETGVDLDRVLWVRAPEPRDALRATEHILEAEGFALVILDLAGTTNLAPRTTKRNRDRRAASSAPSPSSLTPSPSVWPRLTRAAGASRTGLLLLSSKRLAGTAADLALEMKASTPHFTGTPALLEGLEIEATVVRNRSMPSTTMNSVRLRNIRAA